MKKTAFLDLLTKRLPNRRGQCNICEDNMGIIARHLNSGTESFDVTFRPHKNSSGVIIFWHIEIPDKR